MRSPLDGNILFEVLNELIPSQIRNHHVIFFCIGSDRSTGDCLGPLVGNFLKKQGYENVMGTIDDTINAENIEQKIKKIPKNKHIIVIDSTLSSRQFIGKYFVEQSGLKPGAGLGKSLPVIGDYHIAGVVSFSGRLAYYGLQSTKLSLVMYMAETITEAILSRFPLLQQKSYLQENSWKIIG